MNYEQLMTDYWGWIVPMVEAYNKAHKTDIKPWLGVRLRNTALNAHPTFTKNPLGEYQLALTIFEDEPLFRGDELYLRDEGVSVKVIGFDRDRRIFDIEVALNNGGIEGTVASRAQLTRKEPNNEPEYKVFTPCRSQDDVTSYVEGVAYRKLEKGEVLVLTFDEVSEILENVNLAFCPVVTKLNNFFRYEHGAKGYKNDKPS